MIAATESSALERRIDPCLPPRTEALLVEQLARATRALRGLELEECRAAGVRAVIRSLRSTLSRVAERGTLLDRDDSGFVLKHASEGEIELWHRGRKLPICGSTFREAFAAAGVEMKPDQRILADEDLVRRAIEESLLSCTLQEFRIREAKAELLRAVEKFQHRSTSEGGWPKVLAPDSPTWGTCRAYRRLIT